MLGQLDAWIKTQRDKPNRPEAIRRLITAGLHAAGPPAGIDLPPDLLTALDTWCTTRSEPRPDRPGAIYYLLTMALKLQGAPAPGTGPVPERIHAEGQTSWPTEGPAPPLENATRPADTFAAIEPVKTAAEVPNRPGAAASEATEPLIRDDEWFDPLGGSSQPPRPPSDKT